MGEVRSSDESNLSRENSKERETLFIKPKTGRVTEEKINAMVNWILIENSS